MASILHECFELDIHSLEMTAGRLICSIKPRWLSKKLTFKKLIACDESSLYLVHCKQTGDEQQGILIRIYPTNSDILINYDELIRIITPWMRQGFFPSILATFNNGYFSSCVEGKRVERKDLNNHLMIIKKLSEFHSMSAPSSAAPRFIDRLIDFIDLLTNKNSTLHERLAEFAQMNPKTDQTRANLLTSFASVIGLLNNRKLPITFNQLELQLKDISWQELSHEIHRMRVILDNQWSSLDLPVVLCLNNLKFENVSSNTRTSSMTFLTFDHCSMNYYLFDLVSYFLELANDDDASKYSTHQIQKHLLRIYFSSSKLTMSNLIYDQQKPTDEELDYFLHLADLLVAPIHLYWALWSFLHALLIKANSSFDYVNYGRFRLAQYDQTKAKFFDSSIHWQKNILKF